MTITVKAAACGLAGTILVLSIKGQPLPDMPGPNALAQMFAGKMLTSATSTLGGNGLTWVVNQVSDDLIELRLVYDVDKTEQT